MRRIRLSLLIGLMKSFVASSGWLGGTAIRAADILLRDGNLPVVILIFRCCRAAVVAHPLEHLASLSTPYRTDLHSIDGADAQPVVETVAAWQSRQGSPWRPWISPSGAMGASRCADLRAGLRLWRSFKDPREAPCLAAFFYKIPSRAALRWHEVCGPAVVVDEATLKGIVLEINEEAAARVAAGMTSAQAMARDTITIRPRSPAQEQCLNQILLETALALSPDVELSCDGVSWQISAESAEECAGSNWPINKSRVSAHKDYVPWWGLRQRRTSPISQPVAPNLQLLFTIRQPSPATCPLKPSNLQKNFFRFCMAGEFASENFLPCQKGKPLHGSAPAAGNASQGLRTQQAITSGPHASEFAEAYVLMMD